MMTPTQSPPIARPCLIVLVGPPGSGKSTWAHRNCRGTVRVSQDELIDAITPGGFDHLYRPVYHQAEDAVARAALRAGHTVIVDRTNRTRAHRERWIEIAFAESCRAIAVVMSTSNQLCRQRNAQREGVRRVSDERMERMFAAFEPVDAAEGFASIHFDNGVGPGIGLAEILSAEEQVFHEYCHKTR
jgi:predicted kinase